MKRFLALLLLLPLLVSCTFSLPGSATRNWWQDAVFYEIFVRSYSDSDGDGIGDFNGITQKLDYLQSLGVTALWLMPIHPSPSYHGYDVTDYYAVNPAYGTMEDFKRLLSEAHGKGINVIIDFVPNHTSSAHPFFQSAQDPQSPYRNYYIWSETDPGQSGTYGGSAWHKTDSGYYYGLFWSGMPDLNYTNPEVTAEMQKAAKFWLTEVGIDGFRIDAVKHLVEQDGKQENTPANHEWLKQFYLFYKDVNPKAYTVGEVFGAGGTLIKMYRNETDHIFNFELASGILNSAGKGANSSINSGIKFTLAADTDGNYATFLANHDQVRVINTLGGDVNKAKLAAALLLTSPGTPFLYYGEEIGMSGTKPDELLRTPMQWSAEANAGFTSGSPWEPVNADYVTVNVAAQEQDPNSLLNHYRNLITLRKTYQALRGGSLLLLETGNSAVFAMLRTDGKDTLLVLVNLGDEPVNDYKLSLPKGELPDNTYSLQSVFGNASATDLTVSGKTFQGYTPIAELAPFSTQIYLLQP